MHTLAYRYINIPRCYILLRNLMLAWFIDCKRLIIESCSVINSTEVLNNKVQFINL